MTGATVTPRTRAGGPAPAGAGPPARTTLTIEGMTCASCATRIERRLNRLEGVSACVNFAAEQAEVSFDAGRVTLPALVEAVAAAGYRAAPAAATSAGTRHERAGAERAMRRRLAAAAALTVPLAALAWVGSLHFAGWRWLALVLATPVVAYSGRPFHAAAARGLRHLSTSMDTLVSLGTLAAFAWSVVVLVAGLHEPVYFDAAAMITTLILLGRYFELRAKRRSADAITGLLELGAKRARVLHDGEERLITADALAVGDLFVVRPGERLAADGIVDRGSSEIDTSMLTGESIPSPVAAGDAVTGATINLSGQLVVRATRVGAETTLAHIARLVGEAQAGKARVQRLADRVAGVFVPVVGLVALGTLGAWLASGAGAETAFTAAVAVIVCACPCALGLATPLALLVAGGRGAQLGIVIGGPEALERTRSVTTVLFDKTGTITEGRMSVAARVVAPGERERAMLALAGSAEQPSEHPVARAIAAYARAELGSLANATSFVSRPGLGVRATVEGHDVLVGREALLERQGVALPPGLRDAAEELAATGATVVTVAWDGRARGLIAVSDTVKPSAAAAVSALSALGLTPALLTGDNAGAAQAVAREVGIERVISGVLPDGKAAEVAALQAAGEVVAMVGDGINDAPALAQADLGIAIGTGSDIAIQAADLTLVSGDPLAAADAIRLARQTLAIIKGNLFWAFAYNIAAIPLAAAGVLSPILAAAAMSASSVFVVSNSLRLRRFTPRRTTIA